MAELPENTIPKVDTDNYLTHMHTHAHVQLAAALCNVDEVTSDFLAGDAKGMTRILVYGNTLDAYQAMSVLEARGGGGGGS